MQVAYNAVERRGEQRSLEFTEDLQLEPRATRRTRSKRAQPDERRPAGPRIARVRPTPQRVSGYEGAVDHAEMQDNAHNATNVEKVSGVMR